MQVKLDKDKDLNNITDIIYKNIRNIFDNELLRMEKNYDDTEALYAGRCLICNECSRLHYKPCIQNNKLRYSLEAFSI